MKGIKIAMAIVLVMAFSIVALPETPAEMGTRLMKMNDDRPVFEKIKAKGKLVIYNAAGAVKFEKTFIVGTYTTGSTSADFMERYIAYFTSPADDMGNSYLMYHYKNQADVKYLYLKGIRKVKKVSGADKKLSFFGSDFSTAETGKPAYKEWNYRYIGDEKVNFRGKDFDCYMIESLPKDKTIASDQGCGKRVSFLEKKSLLTLRLDFYDENMIKMKEMRLLSFTTKPNARGQKVNYETGLEQKNVKTGTRSHLLFSDLKIEGESNLRTDIFTEQYLTQKWW
jgi:hypothetical protein